MSRICDPRRLSKIELLSLLACKQSYRCYYCNIDISQNPTLEHIQPISRGGMFTDVYNLAAACYECNTNKGDFTEKEFRDFIALHNRYPIAYERLQAYVVRKIFAWLHYHRFTLHRHT